MEAGFEINWFWISSVSIHANERGMLIAFPLIICQSASRNFIKKVKRFFSFVCRNEISFPTFKVTFLWSVSDR
jgi:hypothetical protein